MAGAIKESLDRAPIIVDALLHRQPDGTYAADKSIDLCGFLFLVIDHRTYFGIDEKYALKETEVVCSTHPGVHMVISRLAGAIRAGSYDCPSILYENTRPRLKGLTEQQKKHLEGVLRQAEQEKMPLILKKPRCISPFFQDSWGYPTLPPAPRRKTRFEEVPPSPDSGDEALPADFPQLTDDLCAGVRSMYGMKKSVSCTQLSAAAPLADGGAGAGSSLATEEPRPRIPFFGEEDEVPVEIETFSEQAYFERKKERKRAVLAWHDLCFVHVKMDDGIKYAFAKRHGLIDNSKSIIEAFLSRVVIDADDSDEFRQLLRELFRKKVPFPGSIALNSGLLMVGLISTLIDSLVGIWLPPE